MFSEVVAMSKTSCDWSALCQQMASDFPALSVLSRSQKQLPLHGLRVIDYNKIVRV